MASGQCRDPQLVSAWSGVDTVLAAARSPPGEPRGAEQ
jgi:hypothetical protein